MKKMAIFLFFLFLIACADGKKVSVQVVDFSGTWMREDDTMISKIYIQQHGKEVKFNWKQEAKDGSWKIECDDMGECDKIRNGEKIEHYSFSVGVSEDGAKLSVNWIARELKTKSLAPFTDEIEMSPGGQEIVSRSIAFDKAGKKVYTGEIYRFTRKE